MTDDLAVDYARVYSTRFGARRARVDSVLLTGLTTSDDRRARCVDAMSHGFRTAIAAEACGDRHPAPHAANPFDMNANSADVVGEAESIAFLESRAARRPVGTPRTMSACRVKCDLAACLDVVSDNSVSIEADPIGTIRRVCPRTSS